MEHQEENGAIFRIMTERGINHYYVPCYKCGADVLSWYYEPGFKSICKNCLAANKARRKEESAKKRALKRAEQGIVQKPISAEAAEKAERIKAKNAAMMQRAVQRIGKIYNISLFTEAIRKVKATIDTGAVFGSTEEVLAAIELTRRGVQYRQQVSFKPYRVDFVLDDNKILLEIDGRAFHPHEKKVKDQFRDLQILERLGPEWEVLRIADTHINERLMRLVPVINKVMQNRMVMRGKADAYRKLKTRV